MGTQLSMDSATERSPRKNLAHSYASSISAEESSPWDVSDSAPSEPTSEDCRRRTGYDPWSRGTVSSQNYSTNAPVNNVFCILTASQILSTRFLTPVPEPTTATTSRAGFDKSKRSVGETSFSSLSQLDLEHTC